MAFTVSLDEADKTSNLLEKGKDVFAGKPQRLRTKAPASSITSAQKQSPKDTDTGKRQQNNSIP